MNNQLFEEDFCDSCGQRVPSNTLSENNENWICEKCDRELQEEGERMQEKYQDQIVEEQERESYDDNNPYWPEDD